MTRASKTVRKNTAWLGGGAVALGALVALCWAGVALGDLEAHALVDAASGFLHSREVRYLVLFAMTVVGLGLSVLLAFIAIGLAMMQQD